MNTTKQKWQKPRPSEEANENQEDGDAFQRVIPYVRDRRDVLICRPDGWEADRQQLLTLMAALRQGITRQFHLEEREIIAEALPNDRMPQSIMFTKHRGWNGSAHPVGQGPRSLPQLIHNCLEIIHHDPSTGEDLGHYMIPLRCRMLRLPA